MGRPSTLVRRGWHITTLFVLAAVSTGPAMAGATWSNGGPTRDTPAIAGDLASSFPPEVGGAPVEAEPRDWEWLMGGWDQAPAGRAAIEALESLLTAHGSSPEALEVATGWAMGDEGDVDITAYRVTGVSADELLEGLTPRLELDYEDPQVDVADVAGRRLTTIAEVGSDPGDWSTVFILAAGEVLWAIRGSSELRDQLIPMLASDAGPTASQEPLPDLGTADPERVAFLLQDGMEPGEAEILALTDVEVTSVEPQRTTLRMTLPWGDVIDAVVAVDPGAAGKPGLPEVVTALTSDGIDAELSYFVDAGTIPADVLRALGATGRTELLAAVHGFEPRTAEVDTVQVLVDWSLKKAGTEVRDRTIKAIVERYEPGQSGTVMPLVKVGLAAKEGVNLYAELDAQLAALDRLRDCAEHPTNELTRRRYEEAPQDQAQTLREIEAARVDLVSNSVVMQMGVLSGLAGMAAPKWLGFVTGPATAWSKATLKDLNQQRIAELTRAIPKCSDECPPGTVSSSGGTGTGDQGPGGGSSSGSDGGTTGSSADACVFPLTISGNVEYEVRLRGKLVATGRATQLRWRYDPAQSSSSVTFYELEAGSYEWTIDDSQSESCGSPDRLTGSGTEDLVPDEEEVIGGESGPGRPGEVARIMVSWPSEFEPASTVVVQAGVQLHGEWTQTWGCGDAHHGDANWPPVFRLNTWFDTGSDPFPTFAQQMTGEHRQGDETFWQSIWRWDLTAAG